MEKHLRARIALFLIAAFGILIGVSYVIVFANSKTVSPTSPKPQHIITKNSRTPTIPIPTTAVATAPSTPTASAMIPTGPGVPIVMYHYVGNNPNPADLQRNALQITPDRLDAQLNWLATNGYTPITLDTLYAFFAKKAAVTKPIVLTFDDGYIDFYLNAFPLFRKYNFHVVSFIPTGLIGGSYYMNWGQIKEIQASGLVSFQAHSVTHPNLVSLSANAAYNELANSKTALEQQLATHVNFIAYPFGSSNDLILQLAQKAGFVGGVGTWLGRATGFGMNLPRIRIGGNISLSDFAAKVAE